MNIASNFGSDVLVRPEDEDSPEFKEYLRQLLKMQVSPTYVNRHTYAINTYSGETVIQFITT